MNLHIEPNAKMKQRYSPGYAVILCVLVLFLFIAVAVASHPESIQGAGSGLLLMDIVLLLTYGAAGIWVCYQTRPNVRTAVSVGARVGLLLGAVLIANHVIELFVPNRPILVIISLVFLMLGLLGAAGSAAWERTRSLVLAVVSGVWCAIVAILVLLFFGFCLSLAFKARAEVPLRQVFTESGMKDPDAFLLRNTLEAASEGLVRMPIFALFLSFTGALANGWISAGSPRRRLLAICLTPFMFVVGAVALWHANSLVRAARPPFVMSGVVLAGLALCSAHAIWSAYLPHAEP